MKSIIKIVTQTFPIRGASFLVALLVMALVLALFQSLPTDKQILNLEAATVPATSSFKQMSTPEATIPMEVTSTIPPTADVTVIFNTAETSTLGCKFEVDIQPVFPGLPESTYPYLTLTTANGSFGGDHVNDGDIVTIQSSESPLYVILGGTIEKDGTPIMTGV